MSRIPEISRRQELSDDQQSAFEKIAATRGGHVVGPFLILLNSPELAQRIAHTGSYIRFESSLPSSLTELAILVTARELDCQFEWSAHQRLAHDAGVRDHVIEAIRNHKPPQNLTQYEAIVIKYLQELLRQHKVSEPTFKAAREKFSLQELTDLTATTGYYSMLACALNAFDMQPETQLLPE